MAGQPQWNDAGSSHSAFIVKEEIVASIETRATAASVFGKLNAGRGVDVTEIVAGGGKTTIGSGKESPIHEKTLDQNNTALFTMEEELSGMPTYGDAAVKPGDYPTYLHGEIQARTVSSPAFPIPGFEVRDNAKRVIPLESHVERRKVSISHWMEREYDLDGIRALLYGLSRGLYLDYDGGKGTKLFGTSSAVRWRAPLNTYVVGQTGFTKQHVGDAAAHNNELGALLGALTPGNSAEKFSWETHKAISVLIDKMRLRPVKLNGRQFRAVVLTDMRNIYSLREDPKLVNTWIHATPRDDKNLSLFSRDAIILDNVFYLPVEILSWFRPTINASTGEITRFGCGFDLDPRSPTFANDSDITMSIVLGAGALRRGRRKFSTRFTQKEGDHGKGLEIAVHWDDGWMRNEWFSRDGGAARAYCDTSFVVFNADDGSYGVKI